MSTFSRVSQEKYQHISEPTKGGSNSYDNTDNKIKAYFIEMTKPTDLPYSEYLHIAHDLDNSSIIYIGSMHSFIISPILKKSSVDDTFLKIQSHFVYQY